MSDFSHPSDSSYAGYAEDDSPAPSASFETPSGDEAPRKSSSSRSSRRSSTVSARDISRVIDVYEKVAESGSETIDTLATLLGCETSAASVTTAILSSKHGSLELASKVVQWSMEGSPVNTTLEVYQMSEKRAGLAPLWSLLVTLGALSDRLPRSSVDATRQIVAALEGLSSDQLTTLERVVDLA